MTVNDLVLFAQNTASLYPLHREMVEKGVIWRLWFNHVKFQVIPLYRKEMNEPFDGMSLDNLGEVADKLRCYYNQHVKE